MTDFNFANATQTELKAYAINELDLPLSMNMNVDTMRERITAKCKELNIEAPIMEVKSKRGHITSMQKRFIINIPKSEKPGGSEPVPVAPQGVLYTIPRGVDVAVNEAIVEALRNAVQDIVTQEGTGDEGELYHEDVPTFPFQIVRTIEAAAA